MKHEYLGVPCEFGVPADSEEMVERCNRPSVSKVWWDEERPIYLCEEHLDDVLIKEEEEEIENTPCTKCGTKQVELHTNGICGYCWTE